MRIHATSVDYKDNGILIIGPSGSGKSDLALRLIMDKGAKLVADDYVDVELLETGNLVATCPENILGLLEVRGLGICKFETQKSSKISLVVELCPQNDIERLPEAEFYEILGCKVPKIKLWAHEPSSINKVILACNNVILIDY